MNFGFYKGIGMFLNKLQIWLSCSCKAHLQKPMNLLCKIPLCENGFIYTIMSQGEKDNFKTLKIADYIMKPTGWISEQLDRIFPEDTLDGQFHSAPWHREYKSKYCTMDE